MNFTILSFLACSGEQQTTETIDPIAKRFSTGAEVLSLNLLEGERLANVFYNTENDRIGAIYLIHSYKGYSLQHKDKRSPVFKRINKVLPQGEFGKDAYLLHLDLYDGTEVLMHIEEGVFTQSKKFDSISFGTTYAGTKSAWIGRSEKQSRILFYDAGEFDYGPLVKQIREVYPTPDAKAVEYQISRREYGVDKSLYDSKPQWVTVNETSLFTAKKGKKFDLVIDYSTKASYDRINEAQKYSEDAALFAATDSKQQFVISVSGDPDSELMSTVGPFASTTIRRGRLAVHSHTNMPQMVGTISKEVDGKRANFSKLIFMGAGNKWSQSSDYKSVKIQSDIWKDGPVAIAQTNEGSLVLRGDTAGPELAKVQSLMGTFEGSKIAYIGTYVDDKKSVFINESGGVKYKNIRSFYATEDTQIPFYIGQDTKVVAEKDVSYEKVVLNTKASGEVDKVRTLLSRTNDGIVWLASVGESSAVGINTDIDKSYDSIARINLSSKDVLWYDGIKTDLKHRVIETKHSRGYNHLTSPVFSSISKNILYSARVETVSTLEDGVSTFKDYISNNNEDVANYSHSPADASAAKVLASGKELPQIKVARSNDSFYYVASQDAQKFVGLNSEKWGPFDDAAQIRFTPNEDGVVYTAMKAEKWAVHENSDRHAEFDGVKRLRFTLDEKYVRYEASIEKESFAVVNKSVYQAVTNERMNPNLDLFIYQGKKSDKWHQVVNYEESEPQNSLSKAVFTSDGYGVETVAKSDAGAHILYRHHGKDFVRGGAYARASTSYMYYLPYAQTYRAEISEDNPDSVVLKDSEDNIVDISALEDVVEKLFLSIGYSKSDTRAAWLIKEVKDNRLVLQNPPSIKELNRVFRRGIKAFVLPLHSPFTYSATKGKTSGKVFEEKHYKTLDNEQFTDNRNFVMRGKDTEGQRLVFEGARTNAFPAISRELYFHPSKVSDDWVAFKTFDSSNSWKANQQFVFTNKAAEITELGYAKRANFDSWTALSSKGEHTLIWTGKDSDRGDFEAVGNRRFEGVRKVGISPNLEHLNFVATEDGFEFVYHKGKDHPAYLEVREYAVHGPNDNASYIGRHVLSRNDNIQKKDLITADRYIEHVLNGEESTPWFEEIRGIRAGDDLSNTSFVGYQDGLWAVYKGSTKVGQDYDQIEWYTNTEEGHHFIGKQKDGWHEVHNEQSSSAFESILPLPEVSQSGGAIWEVSNGNEVPNSYVNQKGEFIYLTKDGENERLHIAGTVFDPVRSVLGIWLLSSADGTKTANVYSEKQRDGKMFLNMKGKKTSAFDSIINQPSMIEKTGDVYTVVNQASQEESRFNGLLETDTTLSSLYSESEKSKLNDYVKLNNISLPQPQALLKDTSVELTGEEILLLDTAEMGVICLTTKGQSQQIYHSGTQSDEFDKYVGDAYWGDTLADSRYLVENTDEDKLSNRHLFSTKALLGPFEKALLFNYSINEENLHVLYGQNHHQSTLFINEVESGNADKFLKLSNEGRSTYLRKYDGVYNFRKLKLNGTVQTLGDQEFSYIGSLETSKFTDDTEKVYSLLMRYGNDKLSLQHGSVVSETADLAWDLLAQEKEGSIEWSWLDGDINYDEAKVSIKVTTLSIPKGTENVDLIVPQALD